MKGILIHLLIIFIIFLQSVSICGNDQKATLIVKLIGLKSNKGNVKIALCNSAINYDDHKKPFIGKIALIKNNAAEIKIDDILFGEYAIKCFHDENENDDLDTNFLGMPSEDYGFSNNARGTFGPPSWNDAKFKIQQNTLIIEIELK